MPSCYHEGCPKTFDSLEDMEPVAGADDRSPRHFCEHHAKLVRKEGY